MSGNFFCDTAKEIDAVEAGQLGVEHEQVRFGVENDRERLLAIAAFSYELVVGIRSQDLDQHLADGGLIFDDEESIHGGALTR